MSNQSYSTGGYKAVVAGLGGNVSSMFYETLSREAVPFEVEAVAAARPEHIGKKLGSVILGLAPKLEAVPVISLDDAVNNTDADIVFSALRSDEATEYEVPLAKGRLVVTNSAPNRTNPGAALANVYTSAGKISDYLETDRPWHIIATGNCVAVPLATALAPLKSLGIRAVKATTLQGWSGGGAQEVPEAYAGRDVPFSEIYGNDDEKQKIETEPNELLGSTDCPQHIKIEAEPRRAPWVRGHHIVAGVEFEHKTSAGEIYRRLKEFRSSACLKAYSGYDLLPSRRPIFVSRQSSFLSYRAGVLKPKQRPIPMEVLVRLKSFDRNGGRRAVLAMFADNLSLGAAGSGVAAGLYAHERHLI